MALNPQDRARAIRCAIAELTWVLSLGDDLDLSQVDSDGGSAVIAEIRELVSSAGPTALLHGYASLCRELLRLIEADTGASFDETLQRVSRSVSAGDDHD
jgi:hypothetical protein